MLVIEGLPWEECREVRFGRIGPRLVPRLGLILICQVREGKTIATSSQPVRVRLYVRKLDYLLIGLRFYPPGNSSLMPVVLHLDMQDRG